MTTPTLTCDRMQCFIGVMMAGISPVIGTLANHYVGWVAAVTGLGILLSAIIEMVIRE